MLFVNKTLSTAAERSSHGAYWIATAYHTILRLAIGPSAIPFFCGYWTLRLLGQKLCRLRQLSINHAYLGDRNTATALSAVSTFGSFSQSASYINPVSHLCFAFLAATPQNPKGSQPPINIRQISYLILSHNNPKMSNPCCLRVAQWLAPI